MYEDFVAERINQLRTKKEISAREMSLAIGQNVNYINRIENKLNLPSLQGLFYICEYFNMSPKEFFDGTQSPLPITLRAQEVMQELANLNDEQLSLIIALAKEMHDKK